MKWAQKNKSTILWALTIIVIILIIVFSKPGDRNNINEDVVVDEGMQDADMSELSSDPETVLANDGNTYDFSGIQWEFDTEDDSVPAGQTLLKMRFADFTRNGSVINLRNPYRLGVHPGVCEQVSFIDTSSEAGIPLGYARCADDSISRDFVVLQEMERVVVKYLETKEGETSGSFAELYSIDITTIVR